MVNPLRNPVFMRVSAFPKSRLITISILYWFCAIRLTCQKSYGFSSVQKQHRPTRTVSQNHSSLLHYPNVDPVVVDIILRPFIGFNPISLSLLYVLLRRSSHHLYTFSLFHHFAFPLFHPISPFSML